MQRAGWAETASAGDRITRLQHDVQVLMDGDRILPADGASLLVALDQALEELARENARAARIALEAFVSQAQALIQAGVLTTGGGQPPIEAVARAVASLLGARGSDR